MIGTSDPFPRAAHWARCIVGTALILASLAPSAAPETNYRLAGIVAGTEGSVALIELPDGRQRLYRTGDTLGDGRIVEITPIGVRIALRTEDLLLRLRGSPSVAASPRVETPPADDETDEEEQSTVRSQQVSGPDTARLLAAAERAKQPEPGAEPLSEEALSGQLNELLELPAGARITAVDDMSVQTPRDAMTAIVSRLEQTHAARLTVTGADGLETILLGADSEQ